MATQTTLPLDTWLAIPWQEYEKAIASPIRAIRNRYS